MIKVTIELWPHGYEANKLLLGTILIANTGTGTKSRGNYDVVLMNKKHTKPLRIGRVENFPRLSKNVYHLLKKALENTL